MHRLALRLETALELTRSESVEWAKDMGALLDKADQGTRPVEADLLFDLQKVVLDSEQGIYAVSLVDWFFSGGRRPIKRPLPSQRQVRVIRHLRDAAQRLSSTVFQEVDLTAAGWQPIAGGFYVIDLAAAPASGGTRISGKVINPTSVTHDTVQVSVRIGTQRATFSLPHMPPAVAQPFEVTVAAPPPPDHRAFIALDGSTITFASSSTRKRPGSEPVDTDKLLH